MREHYPQACRTANQQQGHNFRLSAVATRREQVCRRAQHWAARPCLCSCGARCRRGRQLRCSGLWWCGPRWRALGRETTLTRCTAAAAGLFPSVVLGRVCNAPDPLLPTCSEPAATTCRRRLLPSLGTDAAVASFCLCICAGAGHPAQCRLHHHSARLQEEDERGALSKLPSRQAGGITAS